MGRTKRLKLSFCEFFRILFPCVWQLDAYLNPTFGPGVFDRLRNLFRQTRPPAATALACLLKKCDRSCVQGADPSPRKSSVNPGLSRSIGPSSSNNLRISDLSIRFSLRISSLICALAVAFLPFPICLKNISHCFPHTLSIGYARPQASFSL
jgi:hypothetical protein